MSIYKAKSLTSGNAKCSICEQIVRTSKQLPCDHKFCSECENNQILRLSVLLDADERVSIVCPYCRDFFLSSVSFQQENRNARQQRTTQSKEPKLGTKPYVGDRKSERCQPCSEGSHYEVAAFWCQNCSEYLCPTCAKYHCSMKMSKAHIVKTIRDKERYEHVSTKIYEKTRSSSARGRKDDVITAVCPHDGLRLYCEPCTQRKKTKYAKFVCYNCSERLCDDCTKCHRSMKMSKSHRLVPMKDIITAQKTKNSVDLKCHKHYNESLGLFCKHCQTSCCAICAITDHVNCVNKQKIEQKDIKLPKSKPNGSIQEVGAGNINYAWGPVSNETKEAKEVKTVAFEIKSKPKEKDNRKAESKSIIPKNKMEMRKGRLEVETSTEEDWVISMAILSNGDVLLLQLYDTPLKMIDSMGNLVADCSFIGHPWSVAVYNDSLAAVSFSDRKQIQLVNISKSGLELGKRINTRHKCQAVCFARNLIAATCWEGCVHVMNISGQEVASLDKDSGGQRLFTNPEYIASDKVGTSLYISDYKRHSVTALKLLPNKLDNKPVFIFTHPDLQGPKGVTVDRDGVLYISGMASRNIFRVSPTGQLIQIYRRRDDTDYYEDIAVSSMGDKLLVSAYEDNTIIVLRLKK